MMEAEKNEKGIQYYCLTTKGLKCVDEYIPSKKEPQPRGKKTNKALIESELIKIDLDSLNLEKYPDITKMKRFKEQLICVMHIYTDEANVEYFSHNDLVLILKDKFSISATTKQVGTALSRYKPNVCSEKINGILKYKLMAKGKTDAQEIINSYEDAS